MIAVPMTRDSVNAYVREHHRHHGPVAGYRFAVGAVKDGKLCGCAVVARPNARMVPQYDVAEVTRVCTDGTRNACSFLYGVASRVTRLLGFRACFTCILESESGASLKAAGWKFSHNTRGGSWDRPSRKRKDAAPTCPKSVWVTNWSLPMREEK